MKRIIKQSYRVIFVLAILLAFTFLSVPTKAANEGSLTIRKFDVNRYENLRESTGKDSDSNDVPVDAKTMADVDFKIEKLLVGRGDTTVTTSTPVDTSFTAREDKTDSNGEIVFTNLPYGYYLVSETLPEGYDSPEAGQFVISVPMKNADGTYTYDVVVYPKNRKIQVEKDLDGERRVVGIGDIVDWKVNYPVSTGLKKEENVNGVKTVNYAKNFYITDEMDTRLDYVVDSAKMIFLDEAGKDLNLNLVKGIDYTIDYDESTHILKIGFTDNGGTKKVADAKVNTIELSISTIVNESAIDTATPVINNARIAYTNASGDPYEQEVFPPGTDPEDPRVPKVYLGAISIEKVDSEDETIKLADAEFSLALTKEDAERDEFIKQLNAEGQETVITVTTDKDGNASITAIGEGTYYLVETKAPSGYINIEEPIEVKVNNDPATRITSLEISNIKDPEATPTPSETATTTPTDKPTDGGKKDGGSGAKTGDTTQILGFALLAIASMGLVAVVVKKCKA